jgi:glycine/D-amino acid oxidase-like deaminating enzyme
VRYDAIVIGGGLAGLTAARDLFESGQSVPCWRRATGSAGGPGTGPSPIRANESSSVAPGSLRSLREPRQRSPGPRHKGE